MGLIKISKETVIALLSRILLYCAGLFILALGVSISISSNLGVSPTNSLPFIVSRIAAIDIAIAIIIVFGFFIVLQMLLMGKEFKWINLTQLLFSTLFGYFVDFTTLLVGGFTPNHYIVQLLMMAVSIILIAMGITLYLEAKLVSMPPEGLALAVTHRLKKYPFHQVKIAVDISIVTAAILLSVIFLGGLQGIREGTVVSALLVGRCIPMVKKIIHGKTQKEGINDQEAQQKEDV